MAVQEVFDVGQTETQLSNVPGDLRCCFRQAAVQKNGTRRRYDQERADAGSSHIVDVSDQMKRLEGPIPSTSLIRRLLSHRHDNQDTKQEDQSNCAH